MTETPTVAAIIPTMNRANRLKGALESVFDQTYESINAVVVDGGSTDNTRSVVSRFENRYGSNRVTYIRNEEPQGLPAARNIATDATDAELLAFLDDDDRWTSEKTVKHVNQFCDSDQKIGLSYTGRHSRTLNGDLVHTHRPSLSGDIYPQILVQNVIGSPSRVMVSAEAFEEVGGFDEELLYQEDWDFYIKTSNKFEIGCISDPLVERTYHKEGMSRNTDEQKHYREIILKRYESERREHGVNELAKAVQHRETGLEYGHGGNVLKARSEFKNALRHRTDPETLLLYLITLGGDWGFQNATKLKRALEYK